MFLDHPADEGGLESAHHHLLDSVERGALRPPPPIGVKQWDGVQVHGGFDLFVHAAHVQGVQVQGPMGEHYALGRPRASAGVEQLRDRQLVVEKMSARSGCPWASSSPYPR